MDSATDMYDIIIVGQGAAGIAAYSKLTEHNFKVLALEGQNRTGGRVHTIKFGNGMIDLGAEWCHGEDGNVVYEMIKDKDLVTSSGPYVTFDIDFYDCEGNHLPDETCVLLGELCTECIITDRDEMHDNNNSLGANFVQTFDYLTKTPKYSSIPKDLASLVLEWLHKYENSIEASESWFDSSGSTYREYWECGGDPLLHWKGKGYATILDILLKSFPNRHEQETKDRLLNKEVSLIKYSDNSQNIVKVECKDGSSYVAKRVIVTASLGVLKNCHKTLFSPSLPRHKVESIENLSIGTVDKIFLKFNEAWLPSKRSWVAFLWSDEDKEKLPVEDRWTTGIFALNIHNSQENVVCLWVTGENARHMETLSADTVKRCAMDVLRKFLAKKVKMPDAPSEFARSQWNSNPLVRGSYSYRSLETEKWNVSSSVLAKPVFNENGIPVLYFAGEATSNHYYSTVHGAVESGLREAQRIIDYSKIKTPLPPLLPINAPSYDVIIVGAGIAGIGAATTLMANGIRNFVILEASDRIGGRIHTHRINDSEYVELGAQWIHGKNNKLADFAARHGLLADTLSYEADGNFNDENGADVHRVVERARVVVDGILKDCELFSRADSDCDLSVGEYLDSRFESYLVANVVGEEERERWRNALRWFVTFLLIDNACDSLYDLSAKRWGDYDFDGEETQIRVNPRTGFSSIVDELRKTLPDEAVRTRTAVGRILWDSRNKIRVLTDDSVVECNHVVVTCSLGVLKSDHEELFLPRLPARHIEAIESLGFGNIGKIMLRFDRSWWGSAKGFQFVWSEDISKVKTFSNEEKWLKYISGFDVLTIGSHNVLLGWLPKDGEKIMQSLPKETLIKHCHKLLQTFTNKEIPLPVDVFCSSWSTNSNFKGGFSNIDKRCDSTKAGYSTLAEPVFLEDQMKILFAGEACHPKFFSTAHGAFETGIEQAEKICKLYNNTHSKL